jgi:DNA-binding NarL/FixJ family response regulator
MPPISTYKKGQRPDADIFNERRPFPEFQKLFSEYLSSPGRKIPLKDRMEVTIQLAFCEAILTNMNEAERLLAECEDYILAKGKKEEKATVYHVKCRLNFQNASSEVALAEGIKSLYLFKQLNFPFFTMNTSTCCGVFCAKLNLFSEAIDHVTRAHTIALQMGDNKAAIICMANLNDIRLSILPLEECIYYNKELLDNILAEYGDKPSTAEVGTYLQLANLHVRINDMALAEHYAERSLSAISQLTHLPPHHFLYTNMYCVMAEIASGKGDENALKKYTKECCDRAALIQKIAPEADTLFILFRFYLKANRIPHAKKYLDQVAKLITDANQSYLYPVLNENRCMYYNAIKDSESELHHFKLIHDYKMQVQQQALASRAKYMSTVYELEMLQKESDMQKQEINYKTQELNMTTYYLQQRNELLTTLQDDINKFKKQKSSSDIIIKVINGKIKQSYAVEEAEKTRFKEKFDETQREFIAALHLQYPQLSNTECRVCALLRSGFNTKEMSHLLSSSARTIENHRANIRRKMKLDRDSNLNMILSEIS